MAELPLFSKDGKNTGTVTVDEKVFGDKVRKRLLHQVVVIHEANQREGNAHTKTRGEVEGSTKKMWPQKHTGMARMGTKRSPIWVKGGIVFGPRTREYRMIITDSMKRAALNSALLGKIKDKEVSIIEGVDFEKPKTKEMAKLMKALGFKRTVLLAIPKHSDKVWLSARNLQDLSVRPVGELNAYDVLKHKDLLLTRDALQTLVSARSAAAASAKEKKS
ncbi:MAG TPA: 50S ribosomal protein L4 [Planctomycetota bacterium]|nr:50S ribosomal protein L4 [Planctomycetota bacterium]